MCNIVFRSTKKAVVNKYTAEGRKEIHKQLETVDIERVHELMRNPISNETVEFNDNCVSLFVAQRKMCNLQAASNFGKYAVCP